MLTMTKSVKNEQLHFESVNINKSQIYSFANKKGIFISARVHPGETSSSHTMNGIIKTLFSDN